MILQTLLLAVYGLVKVTLKPEVRSLIKRHPDGLNSWNPVTTCVGELEFSYCTPYYASTLALGCAWTQITFYWPVARRWRKICGSWIAKLELLKFDSKRFNQDLPVCLPAVYRCSVSVVASDQKHVVGQIQVVSHSHKCGCMAWRKQERCLCVCFSEEELMSLEFT